MNATMSGINLIVDKVFIKKFRFAPHVYEGTQNLIGFNPDCGHKLQFHFVLWG